MFHNIVKILSAEASEKTWGELIDLIEHAILDEESFKYIYSTLMTWPTSITRMIPSSWFVNIKNERKVLFCNDIGEHPPYLKDMEKLSNLRNVNSINIEEQPQYYDTSYNLDNYPFDDIDKLSVADDFISKKNLSTLLSSNCIQKGVTELHLRGHICDIEIWNKICSIKRIGHLSMFHTELPRFSQERIRASSLELYNVINLDLENKLDFEKLNYISANNISSNSLEKIKKQTQKYNIHCFLMLK